MNVLNRKLFKMHTGGTVPPHAPTGHLHTYDQQLSDQELQGQLNNVQTQIGNLQTELGVESAQDTEQDKIMWDMAESKNWRMKRKLKRQAKSGPKGY